MKHIHVYYLLQVLTQRVLDLCGCHLQSYLRAKEMLAEQEKLSEEKTSNDIDRLWKVYSTVSAPHPALKSAATEVNYARTIVDLMLHALVPPPHLETRTGRFVVGELITCNVLLPLITKLSDPDWLNMMIVSVFTKSNKQQESVATEPSTPPPPPAPQEIAPEQESKLVPPNYTEVLSCPLTLRIQAEMSNDTETATPELAAYDVIDSEELYCPQSNIEEEEPSQPFLRHYQRPGKSNPFYQENDSDLDSPLADYKRSSMDSLVMIGQEEGLFDRRKECVTPPENSKTTDLEEDGFSGLEDGSCPKVLVNSEPLLDQPDGFSPSSLRTAEGTPSFSSLQDLEREASSNSINPGRELVLGVEQKGMGNPNGLAVVSPLQASSPLPSFSFEPLSSPEGPVIIQNLRISGTITAKEHRGTGSHPYTLYTIKVSR